MIWCCSAYCVFRFDLLNPYCVCVYQLQQIADGVKVSQGCGLSPLHLSAERLIVLCSGLMWRRCVNGTVFTFSNFKNWYSAYLNLVLPRHPNPFRQLCKRNLPLLLHILLRSLFRQWAVSRSTDLLTFFLFILTSSRRTNRAVSVPKDHSNALCVVLSVNPLSYS